MFSVYPLVMSSSMPFGPSAISSRNLLTEGINKVPLWNPSAIPIISIDDFFAKSSVMLLGFLAKLWFAISSALVLELALLSALALELSSKFSLEISSAITLKQIQANVYKVFWIVFFF